MAMRPCVLYLRSSKDRSDASPEAQRKILTELAARRELVIVGEYVDVVLSGKYENRPDFMRLRRDLKKRDRGWSQVLMLDFERLARKRHIAAAFEFECEQNGVEVMYANMPDSSPMLDMVVKPMMHGLAEYYSWQGKMKGMAGMRVNVSRGFRAGGRAPFGYALHHVQTGVMREGRHVLKSHLVKASGSEAIARYLQGRAAGRKGMTLAREIGLDLSRSTLTGIEWNALTYAGHTVWGVHNEQIPGGGYVGGVKRRPRAEWVIQRNTHVALITDPEAESILAQLKENPHAGKRSRSTTSANLLSGLLVTRDGRQWRVDRGGKFYRSGTRSITAKAIDELVLAGLARDLAADRFVRTLIDKTLAAIASEAEDAGAGSIDKDLADRERRIARLTGLMADTDTPGPLLREMERLEGERVSLLDRRATAHQKARHARELAKVTPEDVRQAVDALRTALSTLSPFELKPVLQAFVQRVELDPESITARICYGIRAAGRFSVASPAGRGVKATCAHSSIVRLPVRRKDVIIPIKRAA